MRFWIVKKQSTVNAIFRAIEKGQCETEAQVEALAARHNDCVTWAEPWPGEEADT